MRAMCGVGAQPFEEVTGAEDPNEGLSCRDWSQLASLGCGRRVFVDGMRGRAVIELPVCH